MTSIGHTLPQTSTMTEDVTRGVKCLVRVRLVTGVLLLLGGLVGLLGLDWDIQWHSVIGRDRTFTPPHDMILTGIGLAGLVALISLLTETQFARRRGDLRAYTTDFAGVLRGSLGSYLVGFGAVCSAVGFPLDVYWHALYGIDVSLWAPFHTMIIMGGVLGTFGVFYILLSAAHLAQMQRSRWLARFSYAGVVVALGLLLSQLSTFITPAISDYTWHLASLSLNFFPALLAIVAVFICVLVGRLVPWPGAASMVVVVFLLIYLLVHAFVPPMMTKLIEAEHETYLAQASRVGSTLEALRGQTPLLLLLPLSLDGLAWLARSGGWTLKRRNACSLVTVTASMLLAAAFLTLLGLSADSVAISGIVVPELVLALLLTIPASVLASWLAATMSEITQKLWR